MTSKKIKQWKKEISNMLEDDFFLFKAFECMAGISVFTSGWFFSKGNLLHGLIFASMGVLLYKASKAVF